jgi:hypothetical protein
MAELDFSSWVLVREPDVDLECVQQRKRPALVGDVGGEPKE